MVLSTSSTLMPAGSPCSKSPKVSYSKSSISCSSVPVFISLESSPPPFDPAQLYQLRSIHYLGVDNSRNIHQRENDILRQTNAGLAADLADVTNDLSQTHNRLYTEMTRFARLQHQVARGLARIQKLEVRFQRFAGLLVDIGIPYFTVQRISDALDSGPGAADHLLVGAIGEAVHDPDMLLSCLKPAVVGQRAPERYHSALHTTLSMRRKVYAQKKVPKFRKLLAQEDGRHVDTVTPSSSNMPSDREPLDPARQHAVDSIFARRRDTSASARHVFGGPSVRNGVVPPASSVESAAASASGSSVQLQHLAHTTLPSNARELHIGSRLRAVLGDMNLNLTQSHAEPENPQQDECEELNIRPAVTLNQDLIENLNHVALGRGYRHSSSAASSSSTSSRLFTSASHLPSFSFSSPLMPTSKFDLIPDRPFDNSAFHGLLYGTHSTRTDSGARNFFNARTSTMRNSRFFEHVNEFSIGSIPTNSTSSLTVLNTTASIAMSPESFDLSEASEDSFFKDSLFMSTPAPTTGPTTPSKTPPTATTTPSSSGNKLPALRLFRSPHGSVKSGGIVRRLSPSPESFVRKLRSLSSREKEKSGDSGPREPFETPVIQSWMMIEEQTRK